MLGLSSTVDLLLLCGLFLKKNSNSSSIWYQIFLLDGCCHLTGPFLDVKINMKLRSQQCSKILAYAFSLLKNEQFWSLYPATAFLIWSEWLSQRSFVKFFHFPCPTTNGDRSLLWKFQLVYPPEAKVDNFVVFISILGLLVEIIYGK